MSQLNFFRLTTAALLLVLLVVALPQQVLSGVAYRVDQAASGRGGSTSIPPKAAPPSAASVALAAAPAPTVAVTHATPTPKPKDQVPTYVSTHPMANELLPPPPAGDCGLPHPAFCDTFDKPHPGGRGGDLDATNWSYARVTESNNPSQGVINGFWPTNAMFCLTPVKGLTPPRDSFFCDGNGTEHMHWMEAINDGGSYVYDAATIRQPFDFANRTGHIDYQVDAKTEGNHTWWPEVWITDQPIPAAHDVQPGTAALPRNGVGIIFSSDCGKPQQLGGVERIVVFKNYKQIVNAKNGDGIQTGACYTTLADHANRFQIQINQNSVTLWASDASGKNFQKRFWADCLPIPLTRGYVTFEHAQYNARKFGGTTKQQTYHWHDIGFDGPRLPLPRGYEIPDAGLYGRDGKSVNLGYNLLDSGGTIVCCPFIGIHPFVLSDVNLHGMATAELTLNAWMQSKAATLRYRFNGGAWHSYPYDFPDGKFGARAIAIPVPLSELHQGQNTVQFGAASIHEIQIANIDLTLAPTMPPSSAPLTPSAVSPSGTAKTSGGCA